MNSSPVKYVESFNGYGKNEICQNPTDSLR